MCRALFDEIQERNMAKTTTNNDSEQQQMPMPKEGMHLRLQQETSISSRTNYNETVFG
jgi:hypothetical protein